MRYAIGEYVKAAIEDEPIYCWVAVVEGKLYCDADGLVVIFSDKARALMEQEMAEIGARAEWRDIRA